MQQLNQCSACKQGIAKYNCSLCGAHVCERCYDKSTGLCVFCRQGKKIKN